MSRTRHARKRPGTEYWKSRHRPHGEEPGRSEKRMTHRKERAAGRRLEIRARAGAEVAATDGPKASPCRSR